MVGLYIYCNSLFTNKNKFAKNILKTFIKDNNIFIFLALNFTFDLKILGIYININL